MRKASSARSSRLLPAGDRWHRVMHKRRGLPVISAEHERICQLCNSTEGEVGGGFGLDLVDRIEDTIPSVISVV